MHTPSLAMLEINFLINFWRLQKRFWGFCLKHTQSHISITSKYIWQLMFWKILRMWAISRSSSLAKADVEDSRGLIFQESTYFVSSQHSQKLRLPLKPQTASFYVNIYLVALPIEVKYLMIQFNFSKLCQLERNYFKRLCPELSA